MPRLPDASIRHPLVFPDGTLHPEMVQLSAVIDHPNWIIGRHAYANDFDPPADWARRLAPYLYHGAPERLVIGPFCQIAHGVRFITASANHPMDGVSTYPFAVFDPTALDAYKGAFTGLPDTVVGPDCWIGHGALILPGAHLGAGVIVGAGAVVRGAVPPYAIVAGNPARLVRRRFPDADIACLLEIAWWARETAWIERHMDLILGGDVAALARAAGRDPA
jgi:virginiamycin A acetyltransferase